MEIKIRRARPEEADILTELSMRSKRSNGYDDAFMQACRVELTVTESRMAEGEYWVAETDAVIGCVCLHADARSDSGEVHAYFVDPGWQRQGIGKRLWLKVAEQARAKRLVKLHLDADPFAVPFYEAIGFEIVGEVPSGSILGRTLPRMEIQIT